jgi:NAD(P)H-hydrate repair Nnr-like enzyme with NAD(P)H-hydrate dehydratase domain
MQQFPFWQQQTPDTPLFPDIEWNKPEQRALAGRLGIIGGNKLGFAGAAESYSTALKTGVGEAKVLLPDVLKKTIPATILEAQFAPSNISGSLSRDALIDMRALAAWSTGILLIGDAGRSSETAIVYDDFIRNYTGQLTLTRDAIDLLRTSFPQLVERENTLFVASFAQIQKLFQGVYYPKVLTFSMQLAQFVDALHKFTITYPTTILTLHKDHIIVAHGGRIVTMEWGNALQIWRGVTATKAASYWLWHPGKPLEVIATSLLQ